MEVFGRKLVVAFFLLAACCAIPAISLGQRPIPPGVREADKQSNRPLDPAMTPMPNTPDPAKLKQEADELAQLSAGRPSILAQVGHVHPPHDLSAKPKRDQQPPSH